MPEPAEDDLAAELRGLTAFLAMPEAADQRAAVTSRLRLQIKRRRRVRVWIASVLAALAGTVAVVAPARAAVVDAVGGLLRIAGVEIDQGAPPKLPGQPGPLPSAADVTLAEARRVARFPIRVPAELGEPERVVLADPDQAGAPRVVTLTYQGGGVRLDEFDGEVDPAFFKTAPRAEWVDLGAGAVGVWLPGPHAVTYVGRDGLQRNETARLGGPTLIWSVGSATYRLEGLLTRPAAERVAQSLR